MNILLTAQPEASPELARQTCRKYLDQLRLEATDQEARKCGWARHPLQEALRELPVAGVDGKARADREVRLMVLGKHIRDYVQAYPLGMDRARINKAMTDYLDIARTKFEMAQQLVHTPRPKAA